MKCKYCKQKIIQNIKKDVEGREYVVCVNGPSWYQDFCVTSPNFLHQPLSEVGEIKNILSRYRQKKNPYTANPKPWKRR